MQLVREWLACLTHRRGKRAVMLDGLYPVPVSDKSNVGHMGTSECAFRL